MALFAAYISLVPFQFRSLSAVDLHLALVAAFDPRVTSKSNFFANIVLFIPLLFWRRGLSVFDG